MAPSWFYITLRFITVSTRPATGSCLEPHESSPHHGIYFLISALILSFSLAFPRWFTLVIPGFRREVVENCAILRYYAASSVNFLPMFLNKLSVQESKRILDSWTLRMGPIGCLETSVRNYHYSLRNNPKEHSSLVSSSFTTRILLPAPPSPLLVWAPE
jgi:hypothetical protein